MRNVMTFILGGGKGTRLYPLTKLRSKPAVPLAGKYRLIDIPISNCINSGLNQMYVLTQFNSVSLHRHIREAFVFDRFANGFVEILAAQQTFSSGSDWYQGTADAVRKNLRYIEQPGIDYVLILSGDQLYRMDYREMLATHMRSGADVTISAVPIYGEQASAFGIVQFDDKGQVTDFVEKPKTEEALAPVRVDPSWIDSHGVESRGRDCLANMGIYLFNRDVLVEQLTKNECQDFGKEVFPMSIRTHQVQAHLFDGYWEDIGTIKAFYDANLALAQPTPPFSLIDEEAQIYTQPRNLPPTRAGDATIKNTLLADGCDIGSGSVIENSVIGLRCRIGENVVIRDSILMGYDYLTSPEEERGLLAANEPPLGIGDGSHIEGAIVDKNCHIGQNVEIKPAGDLADAEWDEVVVRDGVIIVLKGAKLPDGWSFGKLLETRQGAALQA